MPEKTFFVVLSVFVCQHKRKGNIAPGCNLSPNDHQFQVMINSFTAQSDYGVDAINLHGFPFKGGCIRCFHCSATGSCICKDGFRQMLRDRIQKTDAIVIGFAIKDYSMGSVFKMHDDSQFCNGHRNVTMGIPFGYLICGHYSLEKNLQTLEETPTEVGDNFPAGVVSNESNPDEQIGTMCARSNYAIETKYLQPANFYGVGGMKAFRNLIWLMQSQMKKDRRFYKIHGLYDSPLKKWPTMLAMYPVGIMFTSEKM